MGKTKRGKGTKWMVVVDGQGLPLGEYLHSASPAEVRLAEATPVYVPCREEDGWAWDIDRVRQAVTSRTRVDWAKDVPTVAEAALPGYDITTWFGLLAPAGTPRAIVDRLHAVIAAMLNDNGIDVGTDRVQRIWRREGLKVPKKQPKRSRLWLADGSCMGLS
mgnify:CR=1 FL=1